jgi:hypothetical protein
LGLGFDPLQAGECVGLQRARSCSSENFEERRVLYTTCVTALRGSMAQGGACAASIECAGGLYCAKVVDGGTGLCTRIGGAGAACDDPNLNGDRCSTLGLYGTGSLYCSSTPDSIPGICTLGRGQGVGCNADQQCAAPLICSSFSRSCADSQPYPSPAICALYMKSDAGVEAGR